MTKNQIIAKAMLTTLGIYAAVAFAVNLRYGPANGGNRWALLLMIFVTAVAIFFVVRILVFNNDSLASKIVGPQDSGEDFDRSDYLIKAFSVAFTILALLFLCSSSTVRGVIKLLQALSLPNIRVWITDVIETKRITGNLTLTRYTGIYIDAFIKLIVITYLLSGARYITRWHLKNSCSDNTEGVNNE
ncbi:MAG: hypothetical protein KAJ07_11865 [Planctomycetes bacterium]|nr:hypothetical protein [Planctomycetota bacterium]